MTAAVESSRHRVALQRQWNSEGIIYHGLAFLFCVSTEVYPSNRGWDVTIQALKTEELPQNHSCMKREAICDKNDIIRQRKAQYETVSGSNNSPKILILATLRQRYTLMEKRQSHNALR